MWTDGADQGDVSLHQVIEKTAQTPSRQSGTDCPSAFRRSQLHWHCDLRFLAYTMTNHKSLWFKLLGLPHLFRDPADTQTQLHSAQTVTSSCTLSLSLPTSFLSRHLYFFLYGSYIYLRLITLILISSTNHKVDQARVFTALPLLMSLKF